MNGLLNFTLRDYHDIYNVMVNNAMHVSKSEKSMIGTCWNIYYKTVAIIK